MLQIPLQPFSSSSSLLTLEDVEVRINVSWSERSSAWFLSLYTADDVPLLEGIKLVPNWELLQKFDVQGLPPGGLILYNKVASTEYPTFDNLTTNYILMYLTKDELI